MTTHRRLALAVALTAATLLAGGLPQKAVAEESGKESLELRGESTLGARIYDLESPFDDDDFTGFFDQYRFIETKNEGDPAWFLDSFHTDVGLARQDDTYLVRLERWSPTWDNDRAELDVDWRGLEFDFDYHRYRSGELRVFPEDTQGRFPTATDNLAVRFNPDTAANNPLGRDRRLWIRRTGFDSELRLRPEDFGARSRAAAEFQVHTRYEQRDGRRQDRFLVDDPRELGSTGARQRARLRANRRDIDQEVHGVGGGIVMRPGDLFTAELDVDFESFRENASVLTVADLSGDAPGIGTGFGPRQSARSFQFVPDTDRLAGNLRLSRRFGDAVHLQAGGFVSRLEQNGRRSPLQDRLGLDDAAITTWSMDGGFNARLGPDFGVNGVVKTVWRDNDFDRDDFDRVAPPGGQVDPYLSSRRETNLRLEGTWRPLAGWLAAAGLRSRFVHRNLKYADSPGAIRPEFSLQTDKTETHTFYARGNARLGRAVHVSSELGFERAPHVGFARDLERAFYVDGNGSWSLPRPIPLSLAVHGGYRSGKNDEIELFGEAGERGRSKSFKQTKWNYGVTLTAQPLEDLSLFGTWNQSKDHQKFPHLRSTIPRYFGPTDLQFFRDSEIEYRSRVESLVLGLRARPLERVELSASTSLTWVLARFEDDTRTGRLLDDLNEIDSRIISVDASAGIQLMPRVRMDLGYRFDDYEDHVDLDPLELDETVHTYRLSFTVEFAALD